MSDPESIVALLIWMTQTYALYVVFRSVFAPSRHRADSWATRGEEADLQEISEHVQTAEPPMPQGAREDIDLHFYNRAN